MAPACRGESGESPRTETKTQHSHKKKNQKTCSPMDPCHHLAGESFVHPAKFTEAVPCHVQQPCSQPTFATCPLAFLPTGLSCGQAGAPISHTPGGSPRAVNARLYLPCSLLPPCIQSAPRRDFLTKPRLDQVSGMQLTHSNC